MKKATSMKLYKFRPLGNDLSFCRAKEILRTGQFWCSQFWELNDPMEGVYSFTADDGVPVEDVFSDKARHVICSFSGKKAFSNPLMWGYYANGFKGLAIEIEVSADNVKKIEQMNYVKDVSEWSELGALGAIDERVKKILTTKLDRWKHEDEFRFLCESVKPAPKHIGEITGVYFGNPHAKTVNRQSIMDRSQELRMFMSHRCELKTMANAPCYFVTMSHGKLKSEPAGAA
ncbi:MAG: hypothetical protein L0219_21550 [Phycisphaerales bacterium]|nr:hypothetical protein [Phycisphaerales bacterium]